MSDKEMINRYIEFLINQSESKDLQNRSLQLKIDELTEKITLLLEEMQKEGNQMADLLSELKELRQELANARSDASGYSKKISRLEEQLKAAKADKYGRRKTKDDDDNSDMSSSDRNEAEACLELLRRLLPVRGSGIGHLQGLFAGFEQIKINKSTWEYN